MRIHYHSLNMVPEEIICKSSQNTLLYAFSPCFLYFSFQWGCIKCINISFNIKSIPSCQPPEITDFSKPVSNILSVRMENRISLAFSSWTCYGQYNSKQLAIYCIRLTETEQHKHPIGEHFVHLLNALDCHQCRDYMFQILQELLRQGLLRWTCFFNLCTASFTK